MSIALVAIILTFIVSMVSVFWIFFKMLRIAHEKNLVDNPEARKLQKRPVPMLGGISVFFGILFGILVGCCFVDCTSLVPVLMGMSVMVYIGAMDDIIGLTPKLRMFIEVAVILGMIYGGGGCIDSFHGLWGVESFSWWIAVPLTVFCGVGIVNAINMIDGVNGLSSGLCIVMSGFFGITLLRGNDVPNALLCFAMLAGLIPFLLHNVFGKTSKMFIGDAGTMSMGLMTTWCIMQILRSDTPAEWLTQNYPGANLVALSLAIVGVPVFDTLRVMTMRMIHGRSPFSADKTHLHHVLYKYSNSHSLTAVSEIMLDVLMVLSWVIAAKCGVSTDGQVYIVVAMGFILVCGGFFFLDNNIRLDTRIAYKMRKSMVNSRQGNKTWWAKVQQFIDTPRGHEKPVDFSRKTE